MKYTQRKIAVLIIGAVLFGVIGYVGARWVLQSDEFSVSRKIYRGIWAFEKKDIEACLALVSERYQDEYGHDRNALRKLLKACFWNYDEFHIKVRHVSVNTDGDGMSARVRVKLFFKKRGDPQDYFQQGQLEIRMCPDKGWKVCAIKYSHAEDVLVYGQVA